MKRIQGGTPNEMMLSIDGILDGIMKRQELLTKAKEKQYIPFSISGYADTCQSGELIGNYFSLATVSMKRVVVRLEEQEEKDDIFINIRVVSEDDKEHNITAKLKKKLTYIKDAWELNPGDRVYTSLSFSGESPKGIWVGMRGDRK